ncbi:hypothetical protein HAX54_044601 [Datura stramonium]|uniref:PX domain-containing protein n=1 Tax=Datura stramonium TaxID=4076 RepID=A0ABS8WIL4_DATST|nr:hypothetical protein [Datura stramonium]
MPNRRTDHSGEAGHCEGELRGANPSTKGLGWANLWCTGCYANSSAGQLSWYGRTVALREILLYTSSRMRFLNRTSIGERCKHRECGREDALAGNKRNWNSRENFVLKEKFSVSREILDSFQRVFTDHPALAENAASNPQEAFKDFLDEKRHELDREGGTSLELLSIVETSLFSIHSVVQTGSDGRGMESQDRLVSKQAPLPVFSSFFFKSRSERFKSRPCIWKAPVRIRFVTRPWSIQMGSRPFLSLADVAVAGHTQFRPDRACGAGAPTQSTN